MIKILHIASERKREPFLPGGLSWNKILVKLRGCFGLFAWLGLVLVFMYSYRHTHQREQDASSPRIFAKCDICMIETTDRSIHTL